MTSDEAVKVLEIMAEADGGCPTCARGLFVQFIYAFPIHFPELREVATKHLFMSHKDIDKLNVEVTKEINRLEMLESMPRP